MNVIPTGPGRGPTLRCAIASGASAPPRGLRFEAVLIAPGLTLNRERVSGSVLRASVALFAGAPVRIARGYPAQHGIRVASAPDARRQAIASDGRFEHYEHVRMRELLAAIPTGEMLEMLWRYENDREPALIGTVISAEFDPFRGVVGELALNDVDVDGLFVDIGIVDRGEFVSAAALRLSRAGRSHLFAISLVMGVKAREVVGVDGLAERVIDRITGVSAVDIVLTGACPSAQLTGPA